MALGDIPVDEVLVEVYHGLLATTGEIVDGETATLFAGEAAADGTVTFSGDIACRRAGQRGFTARVVPRKDGYPLGRFETGLITWWKGASAGSASPAVTKGERVTRRG